MALSKNFFLALTLSTGLLGAEPVLTDAPAELTVRLYDYTHADARLLDRAVQQADDILDQAGLRLVWDRCMIAGVVQENACQGPAGPDVIQFRIHPRDMSKKLTKRAIEFGYSLPLEDGYGIIAGVYLDRTIGEARSIGLSPHVMLGHTIAHEIGHLLLGTGSHASRGIMRPTWRQREVRMAQTGIFGFTDRQAEEIQEQAAGRLAEAR